MEESYRKDPASHPDPESCVGGREIAGEAFDRGTRRPAIELRNPPSGVPTLLCEAEGHTEGGAIGKPPADPAQSETLGMRGNSLRGKREIPGVPIDVSRMGRLGKAKSRPPSVYARGKSDDCVVPEKPPNNDGVDPSAEVVEGRRSTKGNPMSEAVSRTQSRIDASISRHRVRSAASPHPRHHPR
jgi:RNA-directed DNA polymerase